MMLRLRLPLPVFRNAKEIVNGPNARMALKGLVANKVMAIVTGSFSSSQYNEQFQRLVNCEVLRVVKKTWTGEPSLDEVMPVLKQAEEFNPDIIIALGGGSVIDGAKLTWLYYEHPGISIDRILRPFSIPPLRSRCKFIAIPTTIGAGSEVSSAAVIYDRHSGRKQAVVSHEFLPDLVILDPDLVAEVPATILLTTVADALTHAVEGYLSKIPHPMMDTFAEKAVAIIARRWRTLTEDTINIEAIAELQTAALMAGWVQNHCLVGLSHAISHQLRGYDVNHGIANGLLMPAVIAFNSQDENIARCYRKLAGNAGLDDTAESLTILFQDIVGASGHSSALSGKAFKWDEIAANAMLDPAAKTNPVAFSENDVIGVLQTCE